MRPDATRRVAPAANTFGRVVCLSVCRPNLLTFESFDINGSSFWSSESGEVRIHQGRRLECSSILAMCCEVILLACLL